MQDQIHIKDLLLRGIVGINPSEREKRQDILLNIVLTADTSAAGRSDEIADAVNYRTITKRIIRMIDASSFYLVERLADEIAELCLADPRVEAARVRVEKPGALRFARSVGVEIARTREHMRAKPNRVFLSMGSNIDPQANMKAAVARLNEHEAISIVGASPVYETAPVGTTDQANFLNVALQIETALSAVELKRNVLSAIEQGLGRVRTEDKNAARTIDLDIAAYNFDVLTLGTRRIPDPDILRYPHVAVPLADLAPYYIHPETGQALAEIARELIAGSGLAAAGMACREDVALR